MVIVQHDEYFAKEKKGEIRRREIKKALQEKETCEQFCYRLFNYTRCVHVKITMEQRDITFPPFSYDPSVLNKFYAYV